MKRDTHIRYKKKRRHTILNFMVDQISEPLFVKFELRELSYAWQQTKISLHANELRGISSGL